MAYIGRDTDKISNVEVLDNITFDGSSSYTLQKNSVNFTPSSANTLLVSIDGVVQAGNFTVSGSTIDFGTAVAGTSTCDFILHYGIGLITTVSDGTITTAKLGDSAVTTAKLNDASVSLAKLTATGTKDATTFLRGDNTFDTPPLGGITEADMWRLTSGFNSNQDPISSNLERVDDATFGKIGTGVSVSSGIWSFPSTGVWLVKMVTHGDTYADSYYSNIYGTSDNSTYDQLAYGFSGNNHTNTNFHTFTTETFFNCTNISTHKIKFTSSGMAGNGNTQVYADTSANATYFQFIRLGDSV